ncbi:glucose-6-phosphate isomerase [Synechococcus sp. PCC 7336]|uniref:glucose-6-phosphate isomerase n=1 Tax=Synechococcus sp. PCC 7336 TaxID=195250 RepID=UPI00034727A2|nr:glucose-6-phosphate isomerase [Synechococcus sp. PCC 7336]
MTAAQLWQRYREWLYFHPGLGLYLDISRVRFTDEFMASIAPKLVVAYDEMDQLEGGAIANPDEQRMVGHYWLRAPELAPTQEIAAGIEQTIADIEAFVERVHSGQIFPPTGGKFTDLLAIGIGGSALGPQFVSVALAPDRPPLAIHFIDNSDPDGIDRVLNQLDNRLSTTLVTVTSKSGGTPEPRNGMKEVKAAFANVGLDFAAHAVAITGENSKLEQLAQAEGWLATFPMDDWVGGRTSEFSAVGLVPAALQGVEIRAMLAGAKEMDEATRSRELKQNPAALLAACWYWTGDGKGQKDMVVLPYKDRLMLFSRYLQQLIMESLGKELDRAGNVVNQGIAVYGNKGSTDQHAYVQQLREGVNNFFATFIEVLEDRSQPAVELEPGITSGDYLTGFLLGTRKALHDKHRDSITIAIPRADARRVGALIALYERAVGFYASLININAYHQPGVEAGKKAAATVLELQQQVMQALAGSDGMSLEQLAAAVGGDEAIETCYQILRHLAANDRVRVLAGDWGQPESLKLSV